MKNFLKFSNIDEEDKRRRILLSIFLLFGIPVLLLFGSFNFFKGNYSIFYIDVLTCAVFFICLVRLHYTPNSKVLFRFITTIFVTLLIYILISEKNDGSMILWLYTFPIVVLILFGKKEGLFWIIILFFLAMVALLFPPLQYTHHYEIGTKMRFPVSFILVSIFSYYIETIRIQTHNTLMKEKNKSQKYLDVAGVMLAVLNSKGDIITINQKGSEILEINENEAIGKNWFDHFISKDTAREVKEVFGKLMVGEVDPVEYYENPIITNAGDEKIIAFHNTVLTDENGVTNGVLFSGNDITDKKLFEKEREKLITKLEKMSETDELMQIYNRRYFQTRLNQEIKRSERYTHPLSLLMIDIDHFKKINDAHGHQIGDNVLVGIASILKQNIRNIDVVARYGGEEIVVILLETDKYGAHIAAEKIRKEIENASFDIPDREKLSVTASFGVSSLEMITEDTTDKSKEIIKLADDALYKAKKEGRNRVILSEGLT